MNNKRNLKQTVAAAAGIVGLAVYGITSATGYLAASATNPLPIVCTVVSLACVAALLFAGGKLPALVRDLLRAVAAQIGRAHV